MVKKVLLDSKYKLGFINTNNQKDFPHVFFKENTIDNQPMTIIEILENSIKGDIVAISFHRGIFNKIRDEHVGKNSFLNVNNNKKYQFAKLNFTNFISKLQEKEIKVILIKDTPLLKTNTPISTCILQDRFLNWNSCDVTKKEDDLTRAHQDKLFKLIQDQYTNVYLWDPRKNMLNKDSNYSYKSNDGYQLMADQHHITPNFSMELYPEFRNFIIKNNLFKLNKNHF